MSGRRLLSQHRELIEASAISEDVAGERGYWSATTKADLEELGFGRKAQRVPSLVIPVRGVTGELEWCAHRPDEPRIADGTPRKYEIPFGAHQVLDVPLRVRPQLRDPAVPLIVTEGPRKVDAALSHGLVCIGVFGTYAFRGTDRETQGKVVLGDWEHVALKNGSDEPREVYVCFDSDVMRKPQVQDAFDRLTAFLHRRGARVGFILLPEGEHGTKVGLDDYFAAGGTVEELWSFATGERPRWLRPKDRVSAAPAPAAVPSRTLGEVERAFQRRLHLPSLRPLHVLLGTIAANRLPGEPVWTFLVGPSGGGKSEFVRACGGLPEVAIVTTLTEAALLSGTSSRERAEDATGGVLRQIGSLGVLSFKDFTSTLSLDKDALRAMLAALREIYDGYWSRDVGSDGGRQLFWEGKAGLIGGVTPAIDRHHAVIAEMGERLLLHRLAVTGDDHARHAVEQAISNREVLEAMRAELRASVAGLFAGLGELRARPISDEEQELLIAVAMLVARGRAAVYRDARGGELVDVGAPEIPTRLGQQLERLLAGMDAIGVPREAAWSAMLATALSSMPDDRLQALRFLYAHGTRTTSEVGAALARPTKSIRRTLEDVTAHGLVSKFPGGQGKADSWTLLDRARAVFKRLPEGVLLPETGPDVVPPHPSGDFRPTPERDRASNPQGGAEPGRHVGEDEIERLAELARTYEKKEDDG
jgi:hypothetical protein